MKYSECIEIKNRWNWGSNVKIIKDGCGVVDVEFLDGTDWGYISGLVVHPNRMKQGIATELMKKAEEIIINEGYCLSTLAVEKERQWQKEWYQRLGYEIYKEDETLIYMRKILTK